MDLLRPVVLTDDKISTAIMKQQQHEIAVLEQKRTAQIQAVGMGLTSITVNSLPAILKGGAQLSLLRKNDETSLVKALIVLIGITQEALNVPRMAPMQMVDAARMMIKVYWYLKPEEVSYAFERGRSGAYGTVYNRLDLEILQSWLHKYDLTERQNMCDQMRSSDAEKLEADRHHSVEQVKESYQRFKAGGLTVQQQIDANRREREQTERKARHHFYVFREEYFNKRKSEADVPLADENLPINEYQP